MDINGTYVQIGTVDTKAVLVAMPNNTRVRWSVFTDVSSACSVGDSVDSYFRIGLMAEREVSAHGHNIVIEDPFP